VAGAAARPEPGSEPPGHASWRSGVGCGLIMLSVVALVVVGQLAGMLVHHRSGQGLPVDRTAAGLARRLDALPPAAQAVPATAAGVSTLLAGAGLPPGTAVDTEFRPGYTLIAIGIVGDCVFADIHRQRLEAWPAPELAPCTAALAFRTMPGSRRRRAAPGAGVGGPPPR